MAIVGGNMLRSLVFLTIAFLLTSFSSNSQNDSFYNRNQNYTRSSNSSTTDRGDMISDKKLREKIENRMTSAWLSRAYENVQFSVTNGNVTLTGFVRSLSDKKRMEKELKNIDGVKSVDNQIFVQQE